VAKSSAVSVVGEAGRGPTASSAAAVESQHREAERLALIEKRVSKPLELRDIEFFNTAKDGTPLSGPTATFDLSKVRFVGWQAKFDNRL
jgi:hypothetical protein